MLLGENDKQNGVRDSHPDGHNGTHERLHVQSGPGDQKNENHAANDGGNGGQDDECQSHRLEIRRKQKEDDQDREQKSHSQARQCLLHRANLPAHVDLYAARWDSSALDGFIQLYRYATEVRTRHVGGKCHHPLSV